VRGQLFEVRGRELLELLEVWLVLSGSEVYLFAVNDFEDHLFANFIYSVR